MSKSLRVVIAALILAVSIPATVLAKPIHREVVDFADLSGFVSGLLTEACGTPLDATLSGHVIVNVFADRSGNVTHVLDRYSTRFVIRNPESGAIMRFTDAGPDRFFFDHEAGTITFSLTGRSVTGSGNAGNYTLLLDLDGNVLVDPVSVHGKNLGDWIANVCNELT